MQVHIKLKVFVYVYNTTLEFQFHLTHDQRMHEYFN